MIACVESAIRQFLLLALSDDTPHPLADAAQLIVQLVPLAGSGGSDFASQSASQRRRAQVCFSWMTAISGNL